jgi:hypothetical protein
MGRQVNFYMHPEDLTEFEADLRSRSKIRLLSSKWSTARARYVPTAELVLPQRWDLDDLTVYICREEDAEQLLLEHPHTLGYWTVDIHASPVVEFWRCYFDGKVLKRGRLYYIPEGKPQQFVRWADALVRRVRSRYVREGFNVAPHAANRRAERGGEFQQL